MKVGRYLLFILLGGIVGGVIGSTISIMKYTNLLSNITISENSLIIVTIIASVINIILIFALHKVQRDAIKFKSKTNHSLEDAQADLFEEKANIKFLRSNFIYYIQLSVSFITMLIFTVSNNTNEMSVFYAIIPFLITIIPSLMAGFFVRKFDSRYPKQGEARYTEKILEIMDEGERHITLVSMFKTYHINLVLIILGVILLGAFSIRTGINQSIGLLILIVLFVYNAFGYTLKVSKFYK
ncbi:DUF3169 family protein [Staphylococcus xylosus]|uniref:DUF3169 family protein n=1 Tax=Staphylococcus xylosus TaxID=1288 RepID=UPI000D1D2A36|nr:DUF3169 family protein [Staphylococcus xylosus]MCE7785327.1 DUF3169 family protein [Staphylococcus xylosus]PTI53789.1 DUF3169 domain-containing protein [Staphylococcus xylosus]PTI54990.1 DUF3169 domain-containing protein [Staphylococcus xylosus]